MLSCQELTELLTDYLEGEISFADRVRFRMHQAMCPSCKLYVDQMKVTVDSLGAIPAPDLTPGVEEDLMQAFREWRSDPDAGHP